MTPPTCELLPESLNCEPIGNELIRKETIGWQYAARLQIALPHARFSQPRGLAKGSSRSAQCLSSDRPNSSSREFWLRQPDSPVCALNSDEHRRRLRPRL